MVFEEYSGDLHSGVDGGSDWSAEGVPWLVVEPGAEFLPAVFVEVFGCSEVEVWVEFVDYVSCRLVVGMMIVCYDS